MASGGAKGWERVVRATVFSWQGLKAVFRHEAAFRQELFLLVMMTPVALWLGETGVERALLVGCLVFVLIVELLNSAVEAAIDRLGTEHHELSGRAKDMGSAAVMLSLTNAGIIWTLIVLF
jgi:diacylglycerol kinase (ATP)